MQKECNFPERVSAERVNVSNLILNSCQTLTRGLGEI